MNDRNWGGPRTAGPGKTMGRPRKAPPLRRVNLRLEQVDVDALLAIGDGYITRGIRRLIDQHRDASNPRATASV